MLDNLKYRWLVIISVLLFALYFIYPTFSYYVLNQNIDDSKTIQLGLDLKGGLNIILELDEYVFIKKLSKKKISKQSALELEEILLKAKNNSINN